MWQRPYMTCKTQHIYYLVCYRNHLPIPDLDDINFIPFWKARASLLLFLPPILCSLLLVMVGIMRNASVKVIKVIYFALSEKIPEIILFQGLLCTILFSSLKYFLSSLLPWNICYVLGIQQQIKIALIELIFSWFII